MNATELDAILAKPHSQELLRTAIARVAYTGLNGDPRVIPIGFTWSGGTLKLYTVPRSPKVEALRANPRVAITIDTTGMPPRVLLIRGGASLETVDGVPDGFIEASRGGIPPEAMADWEAGVRALYQQMVVITVTPDWVKLLDFETTVPQAVAELVAQYGDPRR